MPIIFNDNIAHKTTLSIWEMSETITELNAFDILLKKKINNEKRRKELICTQKLLQQTSPNTTIQYNNFGAPTLSNGKAISISHSRQYCCILISPKKASIDIELINEKAHRLKNQFISKEENKLMVKKEMSTLIWCAKECLFKIYQKGNIIFTKDLKIIELKNNIIKSTLKGVPYTLNYKKFNEHYLVYYYE